MTTHADNLEVEVKFYLTDPTLMQQRLLELGAEAGPRLFESNLRFENQDHELCRSDRLLRLRRDSGCRLTFKQRPTCDDNECKVYHEFEVEVSDHDTMNAILNCLGFKAVQSYEKWRQTFLWEDVTFCVDEMPFGNFLEIEGAADGIKSAAAKLGLPWRQRILANYLSIFELLRNAHALPFNDLTFDNFSRHPVDIAPHLPELQIS